MISKEKLEAMEYLKKEFTNLQNVPLTSLGCAVELINNDLFHWKISLLGPLDSPYAEGMFFLEAYFPEKYPKERPEVKFINKVYHLHVSPYNGLISIGILNGLKPRTPFVDVISQIFALFYCQNPYDAYNSEQAREFIENREEFDKKAREWTKAFASN